MRSRIFECDTYVHAQRVFVKVWYVRCIMARNGICDFYDVGSGKVRWRDVNWCDRWYELIWYKLRRCGLMALLSKGFLSKDAIERSLLTWHYRIVPSKTAFFLNRYYGLVFFFFIFFFNGVVEIGPMHWSFSKNDFPQQTLWIGLFSKDDFLESALWTGLF